MPSINLTDVGLVYANEYSKYENLGTICESSIFLIKDTGVYVGLNAIANYVDTTNLLTISDASTRFQPLDPSLDEKLLDISTNIVTLDRLLSVAANDLNNRLDDVNYNFRYYYTKDEIDEAGFILEETDPVFTESVAYDITANDISNWNHKTDNVGTVTGVKMNNEVMGTEGIVDLGTVITSHQSLSSYVNTANYDSNAKKIYLKHDSSVLTEIDATDFIKDGMVNDVSVHKGTGANVNLDCLVVSFNTDAGIEDIELSLDRIFDPTNYYTKLQIDASFYTKTEIENKGYMLSQVTRIWFDISTNNKDLTFYDLNDNVLAHSYIKLLIDSSLNDLEFIDYTYYDVYRTVNVDPNNGDSNIMIKNAYSAVETMYVFNYSSRNTKWTNNANLGRNYNYMTSNHPAYGIRSVDISTWNNKGTGTVMYVNINVNDDTNVVTFTDIDDNVISTSEMLTLLADHDTYILFLYDDGGIPLLYNRYSFDPLDVTSLNLWTFLEGLYRTITMGYWNNQFGLDDAAEIMLLNNWTDGWEIIERFPYVNKTVKRSMTPAANVTINPYIMYDFGTLSRSMNVTFNNSVEVAATVTEYIIRFVAGNNCNVTLPSTVKYANGVTPTYTTGRTYEINIVENCAAVGEFY